MGVVAKQKAGRNLNLLSWVLLKVEKEKPSIVGEQQIYLGLG